MKTFFAWLICFMCFESVFCNAQETNDTTSNNDSLKSIKLQPYQPIPKKSGLYSAILPGLGQVYNHQVWKVPVIYLGLGIAAYYINDNLNNYQTYRHAYISRIANPNYKDNFTNIYSSSQLQQLQSDYNKYLDLSVLYTVVGYGLQVMDAITSAHLKNFDISRDISLHVSPVINNKGAGLGFVFEF